MSYAHSIITLIEKHIYEDIIRSKKTEEITKYPEVVEGTIFKSGINRVSFWQVTKRTNSTLWVRQISSTITSQDNGADRGKKIPNPDDFISKEFSCRLIKCDRACIRPSYDYAFVWNGNSVNFDHEW